MVFIYYVYFLLKKCRSDNCSVFDWPLKIDTENLDNFYAFYLLLVACRSRVDLPLPVLLFMVYMWLRMLI